MHTCMHTYIHTCIHTYIPVNETLRFDQSSAGTSRSEQQAAACLGARSCCLDESEFESESDSESESESESDSESWNAGGHDWWMLV